MVEDSGRTYIARDYGVPLRLLNKWRVVRQGVTSGHGALVGFLVPVLSEAETTQ